MEKDEVLLRYKAETFNEIRDLMDELHNVSSRVDNLESNQYELKSILNKQRISNDDNHAKYVERFDELASWFNTHHKEEMLNYKEIADSLQKLSDSLKMIIAETHGNSDFISKLKKYWFAITMTGGAVTIFVGSLWWLIVQMESRGMLILFPAAVV